MSVHGPILSLHSRKLSIAPQALLAKKVESKMNDKLKIIINNLNPSKRPISAVADNLEVIAKSRTVKQIIKLN